MAEASWVPRAALIYLEVAESLNEGEGRSSAGKIIQSSLVSQCCHVSVSVAAISLYPCLVPLPHSRTRQAVDFPEVLMWQSTTGQNKSKEDT